jgi:putative membrane protein
MKNLLKGKLGLILTSVFRVSRASSAIAGPWNRGLPPLNSWPCQPFFSWNQGWPSLLLTVLFWAAVIGLCVLVIKRLFFPEKKPSLSFATPFRPLDILRQRYARGEISREEFMALRKDLQS